MGPIVGWLWSYCPYFFLNGCFPPPLVLSPPPPCYQVGLVGVAVKQRPWLVVLELCQYGDLSDILRACERKKVVPTLHEILRWVG